MSIVKQVLAGASGQGGGYTIDNSLRFRSSASAYLSRTFSTPTNQNRWTLSCWVKRGSSFAANSTIMGQNYTSSSEGFVRFDTLDRLQFQQYSSAGSVLVNNLVTSQVFRDPSAWYHIVIVFDSAGSGNDRQQIWVNGERVTSFAAETYSSNNSVLNQARATFLGQRLSSGYIDGYMTEINFVDGQALTADDFGEFDEDTGVWKPKRYTGSYGTNGFYLDGSGVTDGSGNGNNWTANNMNLTTSSATTYDLMNDVPTLTDEDTANFCTWNPLAGTASNVTGYGWTLTNGNLDFTATNAATYSNTITSTFAVTSGKWYSEFTIGSSPAGGHPIIGVIETEDISLATSTSNFQTATYISTVRATDGQKSVFGSTSYAAYGSSLAAGDILNIAIDGDNGKIWWGKNGTWFNSGAPESGTNAGDTFTAGRSLSAICIAYNANGTHTLNAGQRPFAYTPPTGFKALNTYNLPDATIEDGSEQFNTVLYSGDGTNDRAITGVGFQPDFTWLKARNDNADHTLFDAVRGAGSDKALYSNGTYAEGTYTAGFDAFLSDGFQVDNNVYTNNSSNTYVAWNWKANGSGVSNTDGSITSTVSANTTAGFSIVSYTGNGSTGTIGHGLGVAPSMMVIKVRNLSGNSWIVYHKDMGANPESLRMFLDSTAASGTSTANFNNTAPTSSVFSVGATSATNGAYNYIAYCFAGVEGFSKFGSYTGNGSTDGPFVYTGFRPAWIMIKRADSADNWQIRDTSINPYNTMQNTLFADLSQAEVTLTDRDYDALSNGIKMRGTDGEINASGGNYIYAAFAENPFKNALAR